LSEIGYDEIQALWQEEKSSKKLNSLEDLKLSKMIAYLSNLRQSLAETPSDDTLQVELLQNEGVNVEFMIKDLLMIRRNKILRSVFTDEKITGRMTLAEEEFYNRLLRGAESHRDFIKEVLTGKPSPTITKTKAKKTDEKVKQELSTDDGTMEYVMVRFLRPVNDAVMGLDEIVYGPFAKEDIATIPTANAKIWLNDGTAERVMPTKSNGGD